MARSETRRDELCALARAAWPDLALPRGQLAEFLDGRCDADTSVEGVQELALAFAISRGDERALELFEERYLSAVPAALAHMKLGPEAIDDVVQMVREKLVVGGSGPCRLEQYAGKGTLGGLIRVVAVRSALSWIRKHRKELGAATDELRQLPAASADPELAFIKERYRGEFKTAFACAVDALSDRERNLMRLHIIGGVTLESLAEMYGVHRATITRWLARARQRVMTETRKGVQRSLELKSSEFDEMMDLIRSRLDLSVSRVLRARDAASESES